VDLSLYGDPQLGRPLLRLLDKVVNRVLEVTPRPAHIIVLAHAEHVPELVEDLQQEDVQSQEFVARITLFPWLGFGFAEVLGIGPMRYLA